MRLISRASMEGLEMPVTDTKNIAPISASATPALASARQMAVDPSSSAVSIQRSFALPQVSIPRYASIGSTRCLPSTPA